MGIKSIYQSKSYNFIIITLFQFLNQYLRDLTESFKKKISKITQRRKHIH